MIDNSFKPEYSELLQGLKPYMEEFKFSTPETIPEDFPENGFGEKKTIECLAPIATSSSERFLIWVAKIDFRNRPLPEQGIQFLFFLFHLSLRRTCLIRQLINF